MTRWEGGEDCRADGPTPRPASLPSVSAMASWLSSLSLLILFIATVAAESIPFKACHSRGAKHCKISNININPCPEILKNEPCKLKRGEPASIIFDFEPDFDVTGELKSRFYWVTMLADVPFVGMDTDACKMTTCPIVKNTPYHYNFTLDISKTFPANRYETKFRLWEEGNTDRECCFLVKIKLL